MVVDLFDLGLGSDAKVEVVVVGVVADDSSDHGLRQPESFTKFFLGVLIGLSEHSDFVDEFLGDVFGAEVSAGVVETVVFEPASDGLLGDVERFRRRFDVLPVGFEFFFGWPHKMLEYFFC